MIRLGSFRCDTLQFTICGFAYKSLHIPDMYSQCDYMSTTVYMEQI